MSGPFVVNDPRLAEKLNRLHEQVQRQAKITVGPGLTLSSLPGGVSIGLSKSLKTETRKVSKGNRDDLKDLRSTQGTLRTVTWDPATVSEDDGIGFQIKMNTNFQYDETTHKILMGQSTMKFDSNGCIFEVSEEEWIEVTEAVACTAVT